MAHKTKETAAEESAGQDAHREAAEGFYASHGVKLTGFAGDILAEAGASVGKGDVELFATVLADFGELLSRQWDELKAAANRASEGSINVSFKAALPFGSHEPEVETRVSYGTRFSDSKKTKLADPDQLQMAV